MAEPSLEGQILGGTYRVESLLGKGGMGAVYAAAHLRLPTKVAIKLLHSEAAANAEIFGRFRREAEITSGLRHPNIVQVFDFNNLPDGTPYLIMEFLEGEDLAARLRQRGRLTYPEAAALCQAVGSGLAAAHKKGVVHRDLKPQNIFLARHEQGDDLVEIPKIVDFGISKFRHTSDDSQKTRDQQLLGTPNYMSPEQARGLNSEVDHRTDQWALGAILYQCLTGRLAFFGDTLAAIIYQVVLSEPPPLRSLAPDAPAHAEEAIRRALSKERDQRFPTIMDFVRAFCGMPAQAHAGGAAALPGDHPMIVTPAVATPPGPQRTVPLSTPPPSEGGVRGSVTGAGAELVSPPPSWSRRRRLVLGLTGGAALLIIVGAALTFGLRPRPGPAVDHEHPAADLRPAATPDLRPEPQPDLRPARGERPAEESARDRGPERPGEQAVGTDEARGKDRGRGRDRDKEKDKDRRRPRPTRSDADDVDISGIK